MKIVIVGYGNVGKELGRVISEHNLTVDIYVSMDGIYNFDNSKIDDVKNFSKYVDKDTFVFMATPSIGSGEISAPYYTKSLSKGSCIIACEKAFLANNWQFVEKYQGKIKYSATVGGGSGILNAISEYVGNIKEIRAVVNGTLNYIGDKLSKNVTKDEIYKDVITKGFSEPGSRNFNEVIENELKDVLYKTVIMINHSRLYKKVIKPKDVIVVKYKDGLRCFVVLNKEEIKSGFLSSKDNSWFPKGVNNVLYINNDKIVEGPGAGARATAERMFKDYLEFS